MNALYEAKDIYSALVEVESLETALREIYLGQVIDIAFRLQKEGVVVAPPLVRFLRCLRGCYSFLRCRKWSYRRGACALRRNGMARLAPKRK